MNQHQLARQSQIAAARQRLAQRYGGMVPGGAPQGNIAGCGPQGGWSPWPVSEVPIQGGPGLPPSMFAGPGTVLRQQCAPLGAIVQVEALGAATTIEMSCRGGSVFWATGVSTCNECFQIIVNSFEVGSLEYNLICGDGVDAAIWNTDECFCCIDAGCLTTISPAVVSFSAFGTPSTLPYLNLTLWGQRDNGWMDCGYYPSFYPPNGPGGWNGVPPNGGGGGLGGPGNITSMPGYPPVG